MIEYNHICDMIFEIDYIIIAIFDYITRENPVIYIISLLTVTYTHAKDRGRHFNLNTY